MCGRYVSPDEASIERAFTLVRTEWQFPPSHNVAPTQKVPAVRAGANSERTGFAIALGNGKPCAVRTRTFRRF